MYETHYDAVEKVWSGAKVNIEIDKHANFGEMILKRLADSDSERVMQVNGDTGETLTKAEIRRRTIRCAQNLTKLGCTQEDRIGIVARNHHNLTPLLFAAFCNGTPVSPLDVTIVGDGITHILQRVEPSFIFCDADVLMQVKKVTDAIGLKARFFTVNGTVDGFETIDNLIIGTDAEDEDSFVCAKIEDSYSHMTLIACSSGSTGPSKSIPMSHAMYIYTFCQRMEEFAFTSLCFSSFYWFTGVWTVIVSAFKNSRIFTTKPFTADLFIDLVEKHKIQLFIGPICQLQAVIKSDRSEKADLSSLLMSVLIGSHVPTILVQSMKRILPTCFVMTGYGITEIVGIATVTVPDEVEDAKNSAGRLVPGIKVKIINEKTKAKCGIDEEGEIFIKMPIPAMPYYRDETASKNSIDKDGYYMTGDIGCFDESGRLYINGRKKETFKVCGFFVWPAELEDVILKHPSIQSACVVNVFDDDIMTDLPAAIVVEKEGHSITEAEVYALIADKLAKYKFLDGGVFFTNELPMTPSGKVMRAKVKEFAQSRFAVRKQELKNET